MTDSQGIDQDDRRFCQSSSGGLLCERIDGYTGVHRNLEANVSWGTSRELSESLGADR